MYKKNDKSIIIFSKEVGKISFVATGIRKLTSKNKSIADLFIYGNYHLTKGIVYQLLTQ